MSTLRCSGTDIRNTKSPIIKGHCMPQVDNTGCPPPEFLPLSTLLSTLSIF